MNIPEGSGQIDKEIVDRKRKLESLMVEFNKMLNDKKLVKNKSIAEGDAETDKMMRLLSAADQLDEVNPYEGTYGLLVLALREGLFMRDAINELEYRVLTLEQENKKLKKQQDDRNRAISGQDIK
jgi:hypothetical protein